MLRLVINAVINGLIGTVGTLLTVSTNGQPVTKGIIIGAGLTGLFNALKDVHAILQAPPGSA